MIAQAVDTLLQFDLRGPCRSARLDEPFDRARGRRCERAALRDAEALRRDVFELVRLVDDGVAADAGNDFAVGVLPHRGVRAQQVMIDDHRGRTRRALPHLRHETVVVTRALGSEARFKAIAATSPPEQQVRWQIFGVLRDRRQSRCSSTTRG